MKTVSRRTLGKLLFLLFAVTTAMASLYYTDYLVEKLRQQERRNIELWAEAISLFNITDTNEDVDLLQSSIIENNNTVPVILTDESDSIIDARNFNPAKAGDKAFLIKKLAKIKEKNEPITINIDEKHYNLIYYDDSILLTLLMYYPYVQLGIIVMFIIISYLAFSSSRKAEQNMVWVGMSKETAHQLGTPTSSLSGWIEILQQRYPEVTITRELSLDVQRLEKVTERFSRIGSKPALVVDNINNIVAGAIDYLKSRTSSKIKFVFDPRSTRGVSVPMNTALFEWVIENVSKNAIDAMEGNGTITFLVTQNENHAFIDITDTGKGIPKSAFKKIFDAGFTTKQRGWGVGLSLAKRIIEDYHNGRIFVRNSEVGKGSCIRIVLKR